MHADRTRSPFDRILLYLQVAVKNHLRLSFSPLNTINDVDITICHWMAT